jgi:hypothetical protein
MRRSPLLYSVVILLNVGAWFSPWALKWSATQAIPVTATKDIAIDESGYVRDYGTIMGQIDSSGYVRDAYGSIVGRIDSVGYVRSADDAIIGQLDSSGYIRNSDGSIVAQIDSSGYLRDGSGNRVTSNPVSPNLALFLTFFQ